MSSEKELKILLIEDELDHAELFKLYLDSLDLNVAEFNHLNNRSEAVEFLINHEGIDVALLDLGLPESRGIETLKYLIPYLESTSIIVLTALDDDQLGVEAVRYGAQDYLAKSQINPDVLKKSILYSLERKRIIVELRKKNTELDNFAHTIAHDLKQPLRTTKSFCDFIKEDNFEQLTAESREYLDKVLGACDRMGLMIENLMKFAIAGENEISVSQLNLKEIISEVLEDLTAAIEEYEVEILTHVDDIQLSGYPTLLQNIFHNLISNSIKYCEGKKPNIEIGAKQDGDVAHIWIKDNGIGIPAQHLAHVFNLFYRVNKKDSNGTGVGLATCKKLIQLHKGQIWVESEPGLGSTFYLTLPLNLIESENQLKACVEQCDPA